MGAARPRSQGGRPASPRPLDGLPGFPHFWVMDDARPPALKAVKTFQAPDPETCRDMTDVRQGVDEIDRMLVALIARRQGYMDAAARIKTDRNVVRDEKRIQDVLAKVKAECARQGLSFEAIAEPVWREMMERCIAYEFEVWDDLRTPDKRAKP
jgi:isochorismate pyruvate lyase